MDVTLIKVLIWPIALIVVVVIFLFELRRNLGSLMKYKYRPSSLQFSLELQKLALEMKQKIEELPADRLACGRTAMTFHQLRECIHETSRSSPQFAVMEAWNCLNVAVASASAAVGPVTPAGSEPIQVVQELASHGHLEGHVFHAYCKLRDLWLAVVLASFPIDDGEARQYADLALRLAAKIQPSEPSPESEPDKERN